MAAEAASGRDFDKLLRAQEEELGGDLTGRHTSEAGDGAAVEGELGLVAVGALLEAGRVRGVVGFEVEDAGGDAVSGIVAHEDDTIEDA